MEWAVSYLPNGVVGQDVWYAQKSIYCRSPPEKPVCTNLSKEEALALLSLKGTPSVIVAGEVYSVEVENESI